MDVAVVTQDTTPSDWLEANQRYLMAALGMVREALERHSDRAADPPETGGESAEERLREASLALPAPAALDTLCAVFGLSSFERDVLLLGVGPDLDSSFPALCAGGNGDPQRSYPTFGLAMAALADAHWSALSSAGPLRHWRLLEIEARNGLTSAPLHVDERILSFMTGLFEIDQRLVGLVSPLSDAVDPPPSHLPVVHRLAGVWTQDNDGTGIPLVQISGPDHACKRAIAAAAAASVEVGVYCIDAADIPSSPSDRESLARLWEREAALGAGVLMVECNELDSGESQRPLRAFLERLRCPVVLASREPLPTRRVHTVQLEVGKPTSGEQIMLWRRELGAAAAVLDGQIEGAAAHFRLGLNGIRSASARARTELSRGGDAKPGSWSLWEACREQARPRLEDLARRIDPVARWDDLVLPEAQRRLLRDIAMQVRQRATVYESWGFAAKCRYGLGISALFTGDSGTGKTMAAEVVANELRLDLYCIDLSQVVSKYIGETEKNLRRVFDAAEDGGAVLLFDEADALFGKRSEVKDSHDRYANIEVSYLLQRMEAYHGLAILTTNMKKALDKAFLRRIRFVVHFPFPDHDSRAEIWRRIFPPETPTNGLDPTRLAGLSVTGGNIRNIALNAAFVAAEEGSPVSVEHLLHAARCEYAKLERSLTDRELEVLR
jgi:hypothetical protein